MYTWDGLTMIIKEIKNYSGRLRINIVQDDGFQPNEKVVLMSMQEYDSIKDKILELQEQVTEVQKEAEMLQTTIDQHQSQVKEFVKVALQPMDDHYNSELEKKDKVISAKNDEINNIKAVLNKFTTSMSGLSFIDLIRGKHKNLIDDFHDSIWVNVPMDQVQEVEKLPAEDDK